MHLLTPIQTGVTPATFSSLGTFRHLSDMDETIYSLDSGDALKTSLRKPNLSLSLKSSVRKAFEKSFSELPGYCPSSGYHS